MKQVTMIIYFVSVLLSCTIHPKEELIKNQSVEEDTTAVALIKIPYQEIITRVVAKQTSIRNKVKEDNSTQLIQESSALLYTTLVDSIFPSWYDTPWDFNGTSNIPKEGEIACGYFVSTTLKHVGFNLNRFKLAQQAASTIISAVCGKNVKKYTSKEALINEYKIGQDGLFVVGLDYHVGFLVIQNHEVYFVHSDYFNNKVVREQALTSTGFGATKSYVIGEITNNTNLIKSWINNTKIY